MGGASCKADDLVALARTLAGTGGGSLAQQPDKKGPGEARWGEAGGSRPPADALLPHTLNLMCRMSPSRTT